MEWLPILVIGVAWLVFYMGNRILGRLPAQSRPISFVNREEKAGNFGVWLTTTSVGLEEFQIGHVDDWICGPKFSVAGDSEFDPDDIGVRRASFTFHSSRSALSGTEVIGWGKIGSQSAEMHVILTPELAMSLLHELRLCVVAKIHAHGHFTPKGSIQITYFRLQPEE